MTHSSSLMAVRNSLNKYFGFLILVLTFSFNCMAQKNEAIEAPSFPLNDDNTLITYKKVVDEKGTKDELYERGLAWFKKFYKNPTDVIREKDKENYKIKGIARFETSVQEKDLKTIKKTIEYTITLEFKDGRYRYTISNFNIKSLSYFPLERWLNKKDAQYSTGNNPYLVQVDDYVIKLLDSLEKEMQEKEKKSDNW